MGQSHPKSNIPLETFTPDVVEVQTIHSNQFGNIYVVKDVQTRQEMYLKKIVLQNYDDFEAQRLYYYTRLNQPHPSLVNVIGYTSEEQKSFCSEQYQINLYFDSLLVNMETQLETRIKNRDYISEIELQLLTQNLIAVLAEFQKREISHGDICPANVFITEESYKLCDPTFEGQHNTNQIAKVILFGTRVLLAPELLKQLPQKDLEIRTSKYKADVFSLGATILSLASLTRSEDLYNYDKGEMDFALLESRIKKVEGFYSSTFCKLLRDLLNTNEKLRPDFLDLTGRLHIQEMLKYFYERTQKFPKERIPYVTIAQTMQPLKNSSNNYEKREEVVVKSSVPIVQPTYSSTYVTPKPQYESTNKVDSEIYTFRDQKTYQY